ncbi:hypothetical protein G6F56_009338 [Rhizopus delemar]|uniref:Uncharacterized protein n=1 Tax=Rhizopus stolonifer TaxID=4846 RepID=A0A367IKT9_RHIST|nr:hypothetical protein G6F56_009338 [Rhizopus delemar]RCH78243.1 hypothetical protein CU098_006222 [Rhizopus stolonifer]
MDPGYKLLQHIKTVPNLINEDPSITTPKNSSFMDMPWSEFSQLLKRRTSSSSTGSESSQEKTVEDFTLGNWDSMTGYQDEAHRPTL